MSSTYLLDFLSDTYIDICLKGCPNLYSVRLTSLRSRDIPFARAIVAHAARPTLTFAFEGLSDDDPDLEEWHILDIVLLAVHCTHRAILEPWNYTAKELFPLMSIVLSIDTHLSVQSPRPLTYL